MSVKEKEALKEITLYKAAATIESVVKQYGYSPEEIIKLEGNENRMGCSPKVAEAVAKEAQSFSFYPDLNVTQLRKKLADRLKIAGDNLIFGNGSFELLSIIGDSYIEEGEEAIIPVPSFNWYTNVTLINGGKPVYVNVEEDFTIHSDKILNAITERTKVIFLCNPNNPTGLLMKKEHLERLIREIPERILFVIDEAYLDFAEGDYPDTAALATQKENLILLRTFSKSYGLAGLRIGYGIATPAVIDTLSKVRIPLNVSSVAQAAAVAAVEDDTYLNQVLENNRRSMELYYETFRELGFDYLESSTNFVFVHTGIDAAWLQQEFLKHAIMIRSGLDYGYREWIRISMGTYEENQKVVQVLKEIVKKAKEK